MALKLSSREYLSETDFQYRSGNRASSFGRDCKGKTAEDKSTGKYRTERKETMGRSSDPVYAGRILDRAGKKKYDDPEEKFCLIQLRVLEIPSKEYYKKEISLENFVIENVTTEFLKQEGGVWKPLSMPVIWSGRLYCGT